MIQRGGAEADSLKYIIEVKSREQCPGVCRICLAGLLDFIKLSGHAGRKICVLVPVFSLSVAQFLSSQNRACVE